MCRNEALVDALAKRIPELEPIKTNRKVADGKARALDDALAYTPAGVEDETLSDTMGDVKAEALISAVPDTLT